MERESIESLKANLRYIDLDFLYDLVMGDEDFLKKVLRQFLKQFPGEMEKLGQTVTEGSMKDVATLSHHIQSTVSVLGKNTPFFEQLENLERLTYSGVDRHEISDAFRHLENHKRLLMQDMDRLIQAGMD